jgi:hypothetical protein
MFRSALPTSIQGDGGETVQQVGARETQQYRHSLSEAGLDPLGTSHAYSCGPRAGDLPCMLIL